VTFAAMAVDILYFSGDHVDYVSRWLTRGFITAVAIYTFSEISGAHFNPVVSIAFLLRRAMPAGLCCCYIVCQCIGAALATGTAWLVFGNAFGLGASHPGPTVAPLTAAGVEGILTTIVIVTVLVTANEAAISKDVALAVGLAIAACGFFAGPISGASMNPARSIVPQLFSGQSQLAWIYAVGPLGGAVLGTALTYLLRGAATGAEDKAGGNG
jgi:aquaporin Z